MIFTSLSYGSYLESRHFCLLVLHRLIMLKLFFFQLHFLYSPKVLLMKATSNQKELKIPLEILNKYLECMF